MIVSHKFLTAKQNGYGFEFDSLKVINNYLSHRKQRTKLNHSYCSWEEALFGVLEGSILGTILFNIFLSDIFLIIKDTDFAKQVITLMTPLHNTAVTRKALQSVFK